MRGDVEVVVCEFCAAVVEGGGGGEHLLEGGSVDLVGDCGAVDGVADGGVGDAEGTVGGAVEIEAGGGGDEGLGHGVADAVGVGGRDWHWVRFVVDEAVEGAVEHGVDA